MDAFDGFLDISPDKDQGVLKKIIKEGTGEARAVSKSKVFVHYVGTLVGGDKDGEKFDSSRDRGEKFSFSLGEGQVIKAWDIGVATMKKNEICELICKPAYAYGDKATGSIPANSTLKFEIELFSWEGKDISPNKDGTLIHNVLTAGSGYESPKDCVLVKLSVIGSLDDRVFDERDVEFEIGDCSSSNLIPAIEMAVKKMKKGERAKFDIDAVHAFGKKGHADWNVPGDAKVSYEILLKDFEKIKESFSIETAEEKLEYADKFKLRATEKYQAGNLIYASKLYEKAASYIEYDNDFNENEKVQREKAMLNLKLNLALCFLKLDDHVKALNECDKALEIDKTNEKGLYRKGQALMSKGDYEEAKQVFHAVLATYPNNKQAANQIKACESKIREHLNSERKLYKSMFAKIGSADPIKKNEQPTEDPVAAQ